MAVYFLVMGFVFPDTMSLTEKKITSPFFVTSLDNQSISSGESIDLIIDSGVTGGDSDMLILIIGFPDAKSFDEIKIISSEFTQSAKFFEIGDEVSCIIDSERRNVHAQMHTAQHIVSAIAEDIWGAETVSNQLSMNYSRVDLFFEDKSLFEPDDLVSEVNNILDKHIPVNIYEWSREQINSHDQMRHTKFMDRISKSIQQLRVVEVEGVDLCPCAGTHVDNTANIPKIKFRSKKNKGKGRIRFSYSFEN